MVFEKDCDNGVGLYWFVVKLLMVVVKVLLYCGLVLVGVVFYGLIIWWSWVFFIMMIFLSSCIVFGVKFF